jgi:hypothetical protein
MDMTFGNADSLHRLQKHLIDSGAVNSLEEAQARFDSYRLNVHMPEASANDAVQQSTLLTAVALAKRVFLGGVFVGGALDVPTLTPLPVPGRLAEAVEHLGGTIAAPHVGAPLIIIGGGAAEGHPGLAVRTAAAGWRGGVVPADSPLEPSLAPTMPLAGMLAAALAVGEAYAHVAGDTPAAGRRDLGMSLWNPSNTVDWLDHDPSEPTLTALPDKLWIIGLGHLGQAYLWALGLLPYARPGDLSLVLQDVDIVTPSTPSTSILSSPPHIARKKARVVAEWAEARGFRTTINERFFDGHLRRRYDEPSVALCGLDNALGRQSLDEVGFDLVVEAGLGRGFRDFRSIRLHVLPGRRPAREIWSKTAGEEQLPTQAAYSKLEESGVLDRCGVTLLAGKAVGAPFVGATAAAIAVSQILRFLHQRSMDGLIDLDLLALEHRVVCPRTAPAPLFNPGFTHANT